MWLDDLSVVFCLRLYQIRVRRQHKNLFLISIGQFVFVFFLKFIEGGKLDIRMTQNLKNIRIYTINQATYLSTVNTFTTIEEQNEQRVYYYTAAL